MKIALCFLIISLAVIGCENAKNDCELSPCNPQRETVKEVADQTGIMSYDQAVEKWTIIVSIQGTYDSQDIGIICNELPENLKSEGLSVVFDGVYKAKCGDNRAAIPGSVYYYLHLTYFQGVND